MGSEEAYVTFGANDSSALGCIVLGHSLRKHGTSRTLVAVVTEDINPTLRSLLSDIFDLVQCVSKLKMNQVQNNTTYCSPEANLALAKVNCWLLTQFSKCVFLEADTLVLQNCDELFERTELSAVPDVGWPDCFNSGVFVFIPSLHTYYALIEILRNYGSFDGSDQGLLNQHFGRGWQLDLSKRLPFIYNLMSTSSYTYAPAYHQFGKNAKIVHFMEYPKPWSVPWDSNTGKIRISPGTAHQDRFLQEWLDIFLQKVLPLLPESRQRKGIQGVVMESNLRGKLPTDLVSNTICQLYLPSASPGIESSDLKASIASLTLASNNLVKFEPEARNNSSQVAFLNHSCSMPEEAILDSSSISSGSGGSFVSSILPLNTIHSSLFFRPHDYIVAPVFRCQQASGEREENFVLDADGARKVRFVEYTPPVQIFYPAKEHAPLKIEDPNEASTSRPRPPPSPITVPVVKGENVPKGWKRTQEGPLFLSTTVARRSVPTARDETTGEDSTEPKSEMTPVQQAVAAFKRRKSLATTTPSQDESTSSRPGTPVTSNPGSLEVSPYSSNTSVVIIPGSHLSSEMSIDAGTVGASAAHSLWSAQATDSLLLVHRSITAKEAASLDDDARKVREAFKAMDLMMAAEEEEESAAAAELVLSPVRQRMLARQKRMAELEAKQQAQSKAVLSEYSYPVQQYAEVPQVQNSDSAASEPSLVLGQKGSTARNLKFVNTNGKEESDEEEDSNTSDTVLTKPHTENQRKRLFKSEAQSPYGPLLNSPSIRHYSSDDLRQLDASSPSPDDSEEVVTPSPVAQSRSRLERQRERMRERVGLYEAASHTSQTEHLDDVSPSSSGSPAPKEKSSTQRPRKKDKS